MAASDFAALREALAARAHRTIEPEPDDRRAAVALILAPGEAQPNVLFVKRAELAGDPWSGHTAFPGGHRAPGDSDLIETARRETREETGLALSRRAFLGRLDDIRPLSRTPSVVVSPFVAWTEPRPRLVYNHEIQAHAWVPVSHLDDPAHAAEHRLERGGGVKVFPAILYDEHTIWGLTHRVVLNFLDIASTVWPELLEGRSAGGAR